MIESFNKIFGKKEEKKPINLQPVFIDPNTTLDIDADVRTGPLSSFYGGGVIRICSGTHIGNFSFLNAAKGHYIVIGHNCAISHSVYITTDRRKTLFENYDEDVIIGNNVWIGFNSFIKGGITIGDNAIVGAGSIVTHDVKEGTTVMGAPARVVA